MVDRGLERRDAPDLDRVVPRARVEQRPHELDVVEAGGDVERDVERGAGLDQDLREPCVGAGQLRLGEGLEERRRVDRRGGRLVPLPCELRTCGDERAEALDVAGAYELERVGELGRRGRAGLCHGFLDIKGEVAPGREAVLVRDDDPRVPEREPRPHLARKVRTHPPHCVVLAGAHGVDERLRTLLVRGDGGSADPADRRLGLVRLDPALEVGPGGEAVLDGDQVLCVAEAEPLAGADAFDRLGLVGAVGADELLRFLPVPVEVEPLRELVVHDEPPSCPCPLDRAGGSP